MEMFSQCWEKFALPSCYCVVTLCVFFPLNHDGYMQVKGHFSVKNNQSTLSVCLVNAKKIVSSFVLCK